MGWFEFVAIYFKDGFACIFSTSVDAGGEEHCAYSFLYLLGYVFALFCL